MNDVDCWIYFDGPEPESVRPLLNALREVETPRPTLEHKARVLADFLETLDARLERVTEQRPEGARGSAPALASTAPAAPFTAPIAPRSVDEVHALALGQAPLGFKAWAALSIRFLGARAEGCQRQREPPHPRVRRRRAAQRFPAYFSALDPWLVQQAFTPRLRSSLPRSAPPPARDHPRCPPAPASFRTAHRRPALAPRLPRSPPLSPAASRSRPQRARRH